MKQIKLNDKWYPQPVNWSEITVAEFIEIQKLRKKYQGLELSKRLLSLLMKVEDEILEDQENETVIGKLFTTIGWLFQEPKVDPIIDMGFEHNGKKYKIVNFNKTKFGNFINYDTVLRKYGYKTEEDNFEWLPHVLAYLVVEERADNRSKVTKWVHKTWNVKQNIPKEDYEKRIEEFMTFPYDKAKSISHFFFQNSLEYVALTQFCSIAGGTIQSQVMSIDNSVKLMDGYTHSMKWKRKVMELWMKYSRKKLLKFSTDLLTIHNWQNETKN